MKEFRRSTIAISDYADSVKDQYDGMPYGSFSSIPIRMTEEGALIGGTMRPANTNICDEDTYVYGYATSFSHTFLEDMYDNKDDNNIKHLSRITSNNYRFSAMRLRTKNTISFKQLKPRNKNTKTNISVYSTASNFDQYSRYSNDASNGHYNVDDFD